MPPFERHPANPILTKGDIPYPCNTVFNAGAVKHGDTYLLLLRVEDLKGHSHLTLARSPDGYEFQVDSRPWVTPSGEPNYRPYERFGVEDPRITPFEDGDYYVTYTAYGPFGPRVGIGRTRDFEEFERIALITEPDNKDAVLLPEKINDRYVLLDRPCGYQGGSGSIWITYSPDCVHWGRARALHHPSPGWASSKLGMSTGVLKTEEGWLGLYHGVRKTGAGILYRIGALLLDVEDPEHLIGYSEEFVFGPEAPYERAGDVPNVVFPCGWIREPDDTIKMYYGAADTCIAMAESSVDTLVQTCLEGSESDF